MTFAIVNFCPNCGAPIWIRKEEEEKDEVATEPPQCHFSCGCRPEKLVVHNNQPEASEKKKVLMG
jgi:hypothetical protein